MQVMDKISWMLAFEELNITIMIENFLKLQIITIILADILHNHHPILIECTQHRHHRLTTISEETETLMVN
jgi:hypothetical protein